VVSVVRETHANTCWRYSRGSFFHRPEFTVHESSRFMKYHRTPTQPIHPLLPRSPSVWRSSAPLLRLRPPALPSCIAVTPVAVLGMEARFFFLAPTASASPLVPGTTTHTHTPARTHPHHCSLPVWHGWVGGWAAGVSTVLIKPSPSERERSTQCPLTLNPPCWASHVSAMSHTRACAS
jgi:hypothetical protein